MTAAASPPGHPRLHPQARARALAGDLTAYLTPLGPIVLAGRPYLRLTPLLDGTRSFDALAAALAPEFGFSDVAMALHLLEREGLLVEGAPPAVPAASASPCAAAMTILAPHGGAMGERLGVAHDDAGAPDAPRVLLCADELDPAVAAFAVTAKTEWLLVILAPDRAAVGPWFAPGRIPCLECFRARRREIRGFEAYAMGHGRDCSPPRLDGLGASLAAAVTARLSAELGVGARRRGVVASFDTMRGAWSEHRVMPHQACAQCTPPMTTGRLPGVAHPVAPGDVPLPAARHLDAYTGIVGRISDYDAESAPGAVCAFAEHLFPPDAGRADAVWRGFRRRSSGKGATPAAARTAALMEALERYSGSCRGAEPVLQATRAALGDDAVDPEACLGFSEIQYRDRARTNPAALAHAWVPERDDPNQAIAWIEAWSLTAQRRRWAPAKFCFYDYPAATGGSSTLADSNGCAAGVSLADAIVRGILELVERDAVALWWYNRVRRPPPVEGALPREALATAATVYAAAGRELVLLDLTSDFGIPVTAALSWQADDGGTITAGFGAGFDPAESARHALGEMNQFLPEALERGPGRVIGADPRRDRYLRPDSAAVRHPPGDWPDAPEARIARFVAVAAARGLEVLVVNQTRPDVRVPVVKVIVPGLCHFWPRFGVARLYAAPVALGWNAAPLAESAVNPARLLL